MRKAASIRLGLLLVVSALISCRSEKSDEKRCVDRDGQFVDEALCSTAAEPGERAADGGVTGGATSGWDQPDGGAQAASSPPARGGGYHFIWIPYGAFGGMGSYAPGYVRGGAGAGGAPSGAAASGSVSRGGFGATGAAHAGSSASGTAATAGT